MFQGTSDRSQSISENVDDSVLQLQQMLLPVYCVESLKLVLSQLSVPVDSNFPLRNVKYIMDLSHELVQLLIICVMPNIWLWNDGTALKINDDLRALLHLMGELMEYFESCSNVDHLRITYLHLTAVTMRLLSSIVPLELADTVIPSILKSSITNAIMDAPIYLLHPALHSMLLEYARVSDSVICFACCERNARICHTMNVNLCYNFFFFYSNFKVPMS